MSRPSWAVDGVDPVAETGAGRVRGVLQGGVLAFRGVRYAEADRFRPPRPPKPWAGIADATGFGPSAPQTNPDPPAGPPAVILAHLPRPPGAPAPVRLPESEDCQVLNVWTSGLRDGRRRPVMLWLHGGFFAGGSGSTVDGSGLAARGDVVVVSVNHRVNAFGFTHLADIGGAEFAHSGNAGMLDIIAALEWVRDNIEGFGGDPGRVMIFGTSGGGMKTCFLTASPRARGLFHRAGVQSGPGLRFMERDRAAEVTDRLLGALDLSRDRWTALLTMPAGQLLRGYHAVAAAMPPRRFIDLPSFAPVIDPDLLPRHPFSPDAAPLTSAVPMLTGWNGQEMSFFMGADPGAFTLDDEGLETRAAALTGERAPALLAHYRAAYPNAAPARRYLQLFSDLSIMLPAAALAERRAAAGGQPVWAYRLDLESTAMGGRLGATHTMETPLIFDTVAGGRALLGDGSAADRLARRMSAAWVAFATNGDPNSGENSLPVWPAYTTAQPAVMLLDERCAVARDPQREARDLLQPMLEA